MAKRRPTQGACNGLRALVAGLALLLAACGRDDADRSGEGGTGGTRPLPRIVLSHGNNSRPYMPWPEDVAKIVAGGLERIGFEVEVRKEEWSSYLAMVQNGNHQMALLGWSADVPDADNFLHVLLDKDNARVGSANNISFYQSEDVHRLLVAARKSQDDAERMNLYRQAQEIVAEDVPMVPLVFGERIHAYRKSFGRIPVEPTTHPVLRLVSGNPGETLVYLRGSDSVRLDPADATDGESSKVLEQIYDTLVRFRSGTIEIEPCLATSWESNEDRTRWTFRLREGVRFHDGAALDAAAVVNAFERQRDVNHPHRFPDGQWAYWQDLFGFVERVEVGADPMEVVFRLAHAAPPFFLAQLASFTSGIPSPKALAERGVGIRRHPVGTGPFRFAKWDSGVEIELVKNAEYWDGAPALAGVRFLVSENATVRSQRLLARQQADFIDNLDPQTLAELEASPEVELVREPGMSVAYLSFDNRESPFDDARVRRAAALSVDKERILRMAYKNVARIASTPVPPTIPGHHDGIRERADHSTAEGRAKAIAEAKALLREAGYSVP